MNLRLDDVLPLTCTRAGTCCHGKQVWVTPWEISQLAAARRLDVDAFMATAIDDGIRLRFGPRSLWRGLPTCSQYDAGSGCRAHGGRPLACRLYPLGRRRDRDGVGYLYEGTRFPCLTDCPEVESLPRLRIADYLDGQHAGPWIAAQDACLDLVADLGDAAFAVWFDSGLAASGDRTTLPRWRDQAELTTAERWSAMPVGWRRDLTRLDEPVDDGVDFAAAHRRLLQGRIQSAFATLREPRSLSEASALILGLALHLAQGAGADPAVLARTWITRAEGLLG